LVLCILLGGSAVFNFNILSIGSGKRRQYINKIFQTHSNKPPLPYPFIVGFTEFLTNEMPIVTSGFCRLIDQYSIRPLVTKGIDVVPIRQRRNSDTDSNGSCSSNSNGVIIDEWEVLDIEVTSSSLLVMK